MAFLDFFKFVKPTPEEKQSLTTVQKVTPWTSLMDINQNVNRRDLRKLYLDDEICAATDTRKEACTSTPWLIVGGDEQLNTKIWEMMKPIVPDILDFSWWAVPYGFSVIQLIWKEDGAQIIPFQVLDQPFESFTVNVDGQTVLYSNINTIVNKDKFFTTIRNPSFTAPAGEALYQRLWTAYWYRLNAWEFWIQYLESWGKPFLHAATDSNDSTTLSFLQTLVGAKRPRGVITNLDTKLSVVDGTGSGSISFRDFEVALSERIQRLILGQTLTSGTQGVGSQALGTVHNEVRDDKRVADCKLLEKTVQDIIQAYMDLNEIPGEVPLFQFKHTAGINTELAERDNLLLAQGVQHTEKYYEENYDFDPEDFKLVPVATQQPFFSIGPPSNTPSQPIQSEQGLENGNGHDKFAISVDSETTSAQIETEDNAIANASPIFTETEIQVAIKKSKNKKELIKNLATLMGKKPSAFEDDVTKALLMANVQGFDHGSNGN